MKLWLASYPRSGNTYFRILLDLIFQTKSGEYRNNHWKTKLFPKYTLFPVVKTHLLPNQLFPKSKNIPAIYLVRDGRDAIISLAHHKKDLINPGSEFNINVREIIQSKKGSYFGGWSHHVRSWLDRADIIIRYEDLIKSPIDTLEPLKQYLNLPAPQLDEIPDFQSLKFNKDRKVSDSVSLGINKKPKRRENFFRRGIAGSWKDEMPEDLHKLFWEYHGDMMIKLGYTEGIIR